MTTKHRNLSEVVRDYLKARPGQRYSCNQLAAALGINHAMVLRALMEANPNEIKGELHRHYSVYYAEASGAVAVPQVAPMLRERTQYRQPQAMRDIAARIAAERAQIASGPSGAAQEMSELDRNKLAMIGSSN
jgi:hypothetical protein